MMDILSTPSPHKTADPHADIQKRLEQALSPETENKQSDFALALADVNYEPTAQTNLQTEENGFGLFDLVDMVNPLQHIPLINTAYRGLTGDDIHPVSRIVGGAVFGGPAGAAAGVVNAAVENETGKDVTENAMAMLDRGGPSITETSRKPYIERLTAEYREPISRVELDKPHIIRLSE